MIHPQANGAVATAIPGSSRRSDDAAAVVETLCVSQKMSRAPSPMVEVLVDSDVVEVHDSDEQQTSKSFVFVCLLVDIVLKTHRNNVCILN